MSKWMRTANYIISKKGEVSIMELLKLSYIAHGYSLAINNTPLIDCPIEAWPLGPVAVEMYREFRPSYGIVIRAPHGDKIAEDEKSKAALDAVIQEFDGKSAYELSDITHMEGSPWTETVRKSGFYAEIKDELTREYYTMDQKAC